jgi:hypothetical protein
MGHQETAGVLWELAVLCGAFGVDLQRTSREQVIKNQTLKNYQNFQKRTKSL